MKRCNRRCRSFCAHAERLRLKTGRACAHLDPITGQNVRICSTCHQKSENSYFCQPTIVGTARLLDSQQTLRDAFASRDMIELDRDIDSERDDTFTGTFAPLPRLRPAPSSVPPPTPPSHPSPPSLPQKQPVRPGLAVGHS